MNLRLSQANAISVINLDFRLKKNNSWTAKQIHQPYTFLITGGLFRRMSISSPWAGRNLDFHKGHSRSRKFVQF
jgi:hypothetical protein